MGYSHHLAAMVVFYCLSAVASNCCTCAVDHPKSLCVLSKFTNIRVLVGFTPLSLLANLTGSWHNLLLMTPGIVNRYLTISTTDLTAGIIIKV